MIQLSDGTTSLTLDPDLYWSDEFDWSPVQQNVEFGITGAQIIDLGVKQAGRPITLRPDADDAAWLPRSTLVQLRIWEALPEQVFSLSLRGQSYSVVFNRSQGAPVEARPVVFVAGALPGELGDWYLATLRFMTV